MTNKLCGRAGSSILLGNRTLALLRSLACWSSFRETRPSSPVNNSISAGMSRSSSGKFAALPVPQRHIRKKRKDKGQLVPNVAPCRPKHLGNDTYIPGLHHSKNESHDSEQESDYACDSHGHFRLCIPSFKVVIHEFSLAEEVVLREYDDEESYIPLAKQSKEILEDSEEFVAASDT